MPHLAARAGLGLVVELQAGVGLGGQGRPLLCLVSQQIGHLDPGVGGSRAERSVIEGADVLFELVACDRPTGLSARRLSHRRSAPRREARSVKG